MHILQDRDSVILIMYNQSNAPLTFLKCKAHLITIIILKVILR